MSPTDSVHAETFVEAWMRHENAVRAIDVRETQRPNIDVILVAAQVQRVAARIAPYRERLLELPRFQAAWIDDLASLARAAMWAGMGVKAIGRPAAHAAALVTKARAHRVRLAAALASKAAFAEQPGARRMPRLAGRSPAQHAVVLQALVMALRAEGLEGTPAKPEDLQAAEEIVQELMLVSTSAATVPEAVVEARELRAKALVLLRRTYDQVRAGLLYVGRDEPGISRVLPPLWSVRGPNVGKRRRVKGETGEPRGAEAGGGG